MGCAYRLDSGAQVAGPGRGTDNVLLVQLTISPDLRAGGGIRTQMCFSDAPLSQVYAGTDTLPKRSWSDLKNVLI